MKYYSLKDIAEMLGVHYNTVFNWVSRDKILKGIKLTQSWRVREDDLMKFLEDRENTK